MAARAVRMYRRGVPPLLVRTPRFATLQQAVPIRLRVAHLLRVRIVRPVRLRRFRAARLRLPGLLRPRPRQGGQDRRICGDGYSRLAACAGARLSADLSARCRSRLGGNRLLFLKPWFLSKLKFEKKHAYNQIRGACQIHGVCCPLLLWLRECLRPDRC